MLDSDWQPSSLSHRISRVAYPVGVVSKETSGTEGGPVHCIDKLSKKMSAFRLFRLWTRT